MSDKFGEFKWNCYKDTHPKSGMHVYVYDIERKGDEIDIDVAENFCWEDSYYWCYVYMPDAPVIEKKEEATISDLCKVMYTLQEKIKRIETKTDLIIDAFQRKR
jgi:hypothetical protein